ncbi:MAG: carboxypeptidase regulatory-like domain-containing protein [Candidatus Binatia bacterium]
MPAVTSTPTETPTATTTPSPFTVSGTLRYYVDDRPIAGATVTASGTPGTVSDVSDANGAYSLALPAGNWTVTPRKIGDLNFSVTAFDATLILQYIANPAMFPLSDLQLLACDVTANGTCSALDATRILQFVAQIPPGLQAPGLCNSDWLFVPMPDPAPNQTLIEPMLANNMCVMGAVEYTPLAGSATGQDFIGLVIGDVSGNWMPQ